jgi:hypothetical protein
MAKKWKHRKQEEKFEKPAEIKLEKKVALTPPHGENRNLSEPPVETRYVKEKLPCLNMKEGGQCEIYAWCPFEVGFATPTPNRANMQECDEYKPSA